MKLSFLGATRTVTGSSYLLEVNGKKILVDCGMFQGGKKIEQLNRRKFPVDPKEVSAIILTHAHIDHSGLLPKFCKEGFAGKIYATNSTADLCGIMLPDSAHIQEYDTNLLNRKRRRGGKTELEILYSVNDAENVQKLFERTAYNAEFSPIPGIKATFRNAGHILGSAFVELMVSEEGKEPFRMLFSGDMGRQNQPIIDDPYAESSDVDYLVLEGTYGDRLHDRDSTEEELVDIINKTLERKGNVVIPSFAVGRAQSLLYILYTLMKAEKIPWADVYLDSPLAVSATKITVKNMDEIDEEARNALLNAETKIRNFHFTMSAEESRSINEITGGAIIISASGMADAGRILHHLKYNLWRPEASVVFVGYQVEGTLGRRLIDGFKKVRILGEQIAVKAEIYNLSGFSAHGDQEELLSWLGHFKQDIKDVFLIHGEEEVLGNFSKKIKDELGLRTTVPYLGDQYEIDKESVKYMGSLTSGTELLEPDLATMFNNFEDNYRVYRNMLLESAEKQPVENKEVLQRLIRIDRFLRKSIEDFRE